MGLRLYSSEICCELYTSSVAGCKPDAGREVWARPMAHPFKEGGVPKEEEVKSSEKFQR